MERAVQNCNGAFRFASDQLKSDLYFAKYQLITHSNSLESLETPVFMDREDILKLAESNELHLISLPDYVNDKEIVQACVLKNGHQLEYASEHLRDDLETLEIAMLQNTFAFRYASGRLKSDRDFNSQLLMNSFPSLLYFMPQDFKTDKSFILPLLKQDHEIMNYVDESLKKDRDFVFQACMENPLCTLFIDEELKQDVDFCVSLLKVNGLCLRGLAIRRSKEDYLVSYFRTAIIQNGFMNELMSDNLNTWKILRNETAYSNAMIPKRFHTFPIEA